MSVFKLIRTMLGLGTAEDEAEGTDVTVEREPAEEEAAAAGADATASTGSTTEEGAAEAGTDVGDDSGTDTAAESAGATDSAPDEPETDDEPVENVSGIGPAYAERLGEAGVDTVGDLLAVDPEELASETDLSAKRIRRWQERAEDR